MSDDLVSSMPDLSGKDLGNGLDITNIFPTLGRFFVNNVVCQSNHFFKTYNKAKCYEKNQIFNP